jgi:hypothetical protein
MERKPMHKFIQGVGFVSFILFVFVFSLKGQNRFEGYNIIVDAPETQTATACAIRYMPPTTVITVTDLNPASKGGTQMKVAPCGGTNTKVVSANAAEGSVTLSADAASNKWCFTGEDKLYGISFTGDSFVGKVAYNWPAQIAQKGFYNVKDFGAVGDGKTDDTVAIRSALVYMASRNGGTLEFPEGDYLVGANDPNFKGITLPSNVTLTGAGSTVTGGPTNNALEKGGTRITLSGINRAIFRIGECTQRVRVSDMELYANSSQNTYGIEAVGAYNSSEDFYFERLVFNNFFRGIYAHGLNVTNLNWQFDYVKVSKCRFVFNQDAGIWVDTRNSDWKVTGCFFVNPKKTPEAKANSIYVLHSAAFFIEDTFSGGFAHARGGDFIHIVDPSIVTIIGSQCEAMERSIVYGEYNMAGHYSYPITLINNVFWEKIEIKARSAIVSNGNLYGPDTFNARDDVRIYSTGDRFCYDGYIFGCQKATATASFNGGQLIFMTGQPTEGSAPGRPTVIGTDTEIKSNAPVNNQTDSSRPVLSLSSNNAQKPLLLLGDPQSGYLLRRDQKGWLNFQNTGPGTQRGGYSFDGPVQLPSIRFNDLKTVNAGNGSMVFCADCQRDTAPCRAGGSGAPAMFINGAWECK